MAATSTTRTRTIRRIRLGILLGLLGLAIAAHLLSDYFPPPHIDDSSLSGQTLRADVEALGGRASVMSRNYGILGRFGRSERFHVQFLNSTIDDQAFGLFLEKHGRRIWGLDLRNTPITDAGLRHLSRVGTLQQLVLGNQSQSRRFRSGRIISPRSPITDAGLVHLNGLGHLASLTLEGLPITDAGLASLKDVPGLLSLHLEATEVNGPGLGLLKSLPGLEALTLQGGAFDDTSIGYLAGAPHLTSLQLMGVSLTAEGLKAMKTMPRLQYLGLRGCGLLDEDIVELREARPELKIEWR
jgi:hypothetical protein